jgi:hypothetical protein
VHFNFFLKAPDSPYRSGYFVTLQLQVTMLRKVRNLQFVRHFTFVRMTVIFFPALYFSCRMLDLFIHATNFAEGDIQRQQIDVHGLHGPYYVLISYKPLSLVKLE